MEPVSLMFALFRDTLGASPLTKEQRAHLTEEALASLYALSKEHDMAHMVAHALSKQGILGDDEISQKFIKKQMLAVYRYERLNATYQRICSLLREASIAFIPLKGSVIRALYPDPYLRTSCDIDILVKEEALDTAIAILSDKIGFTKEPEKMYHDVSLYLVGNVHLELHFNILETIPAMDKVLARAWDYALPVEEGSPQLRFTDEFLLFHIIAHTAYHFLKGGCGIRPIMDLWLLLGTPYDSEKLHMLLAEAQLATFFEGATELARVWFEGEIHTPLTQSMTAYILGAGTYGSVENRLSVEADKSKGRFGYLLRRIFMPYGALCGQYPKLKKWPILYPVYTVARWFRAFNKKKRKRAVEEVRRTTALSTEKTQAVSDMLAALSLSL